MLIFGTVYGFGKPLDNLVLKLERAKKHILALESERDRFFQDKPFIFENKTDSKTGERTYYVQAVKPVPMEFSIILSDVLHNLRSTLDHMAYHLVCKGVGAVKSFSDAKFPTGNSFPDYESQKLRATQGMTTDAVKAIDALQPYVGGTGEYFVHLARLSNFDKHRLLLTALSCFEGHTAFPSDREMLAKFHGGKSSDYSDSFMAPPKRVFPLKTGDAILVVPASEIEGSIKFLIGVAFAEPDIVRGNPAIETLHEMLLLVRRVVFDFETKGLL